MDLSDRPQTLTVEEAAKVLRIGRTAAYALAREWRATNGASGLPVLELGRSLRVPRQALLSMLEQSTTPSRDHKPQCEEARRRPKARRRAEPSQVPLWDDPRDPAA